MTIRVTDVNDNAPKFELPDYQAHNVDEDYPLGTSILKVKAVDADSGANAEIEYHVSDDHFVVDASGIVSNNKQLDADNNNAYYEFVITAKDKGMLNFSCNLRSRVKCPIKIIINLSKLQANHLKRVRLLFVFTRRIRMTKSLNFLNKCIRLTSMKMPVLTR